MFFLFFGEKTAKNDIRHDPVMIDELQNVRSSKSDEEQLCHGDLSTPIH